MKGNRGGQRTANSATMPQAPVVTPTPVTPPTPAQVASGNVLPRGGVAFNDFEKMTDDEKADVITKSLGVGVPMFLDGSDLQKFAYFTGMSDKPTVVSDSALAKLPGTMLYRGIHDSYNRSTDIGYTSNDIYKQIADGDYTMYSDSGGSVHGKGIYFGEDFGTASSYAARGRNPIAMRAKITSGKTISESSLHSQYNSDLRRGTKLALACSNADRASAAHLYALAKGYSVVRASNGYNMVLNRKCLTISDTTKSTQGRSSW